MNLYYIYITFFLWLQLNICNGQFWEKIIKSKWKVSLNAMFLGWFCNVNMFTFCYFYFLNIRCENSHKIFIYFLPTYY